MKFLFSLFLVITCLQARAVVFYAASMSRADVGAAVALAGDGDTVLVPPGLADWTSTLTVPVAITLQFAGAGQSIIEDDIPSGNSTPATQAVIIFSQSNTNLLTCLKGLQIEHGLNARPSAWSSGAVQLANTSANNRVDDCLFLNLQNNAIITYQSATGCVDHNYFYRETADAVEHDVYVTPAGWAGGTYGDGSWTTPSPWGSFYTLCIEYNTFFSTINQTVAAIDGLQGARYTVRDNTFVDAFILAHGTETGGLGRSTRSGEIYKNTFSWTAGSRTVIGEFRGGKYLIWSNTATGNFQNAFQLSAYMASTYYEYWGCVSGTNFLTGNNLPPVSTNAATATGASLQIAGNWASLLGCTAVDQNIALPPLGMAPTNQASYTVTNFGSILTAAYDGTHTTFTFAVSGNTATVWHSGDTIVFYPVNTNIPDQCGTGAGVTVTRDSAYGQPLNWPGNELAPCYAWGNTLNGNPANLYASCLNIVTNQHFYNGVAAPGYAPLVDPNPLDTALFTVVVTNTAALTINCTNTAPLSITVK